MAPPTTPAKDETPTRPAAPVKRAGPPPVVVDVPLTLTGAETATVLARVDGTTAERATGATEVAEVGAAGGGVGAPAARTTLELAPGWVTSWTCGTVYWLLPTVMVVAGLGPWLAAAAAAVVLVMGAVPGAPSLEGAVGWGAAGVGTSVMVDGMAVMMAGFSLMCGAQMPAKLDSAFWRSASSLLQLSRHWMTSVVNSGATQKQGTSVLSLQSVMCNQVLRHRGRRDGAGTSWTGATSAGVAGAAGCEGADGAGWKTVEVDETRMVESEKVVSTLVSEPDVTVAVTGQVVTEVEML